MRKVLRRGAEDRRRTVKARPRKGAALLALDRHDEALACLEVIESNREAAALMRDARRARRTTAWRPPREVPERGVQRRPW